MAQINISIDTTDKSKTTIELDGKKLKDVYSLYMYGIDNPEYMSLEINQAEKVDSDKDGTLHKFTRLVASEQGLKAEKEETKALAEEERLELAQALLGREIKTGV
jgi:hypothetical protein